MAKHEVREIVEQKAVVRDAPPVRHEINRTFELPVSLYAVTAGLYLTFLAVMAIGLSSPGLIIPIAICVIFVFGFFGVPAAWTRMAPESRKDAKTWGQFLQGGIDTYTGRLKARDAVAQMLILPVLIVAWALVTVTIAALV